MKKVNYLFIAILSLLFSCCSDSEETEQEMDDTTFVMDVSWKGNTYHVKSTYDKDGNLVYLDDSFLSIYNNEILTNDSVVTYDAGEKSLAYYTSVDEMMESLGLRFLDAEIPWRLHNQRQRHRQEWLVQMLKLAGQSYISILTMQARFWDSMLTIRCS